MYLLLLIIAASATTTIISGPELCPTCLLMNGTCYKSSYLLDLQAPFRKDIVIHKLGILRSRNILFFSFEPEIEDLEYYKTGFVYLDNPEQTGIITSSKQVLNFGTFGIDQERNLIYFGGSNGIFVLNLNTDTMASHSSLGDTITNIEYKNQVYFTRENYEGVVVKQGEYFKTYIENIFVKKFVVSKLNVLVYLNNTGLYVTKGSVVQKLSSNAFFRGLSIDLDDNVYAWWINAVYRIVIEKDLMKSSMFKMAEIHAFGAMTFDNDNNMLFTSGSSLFRLSQGC